MQRSLLDLRSLEDSPTVANCRMNREREIRGTNSYAADLGFDVIDLLRGRLERREAVAWLDLCCGSGRALIQAAAGFREQGLTNRVSLLGLDLVDMFAAVPAGIENLTFTAASAHDWKPTQGFDLITCVHGLHYVGDKLDLIARGASWLRPDGLFAAHLDLSNVNFIKRSGLAPSSHEPPVLSRGSDSLGVEPKTSAKSANALLGKEFKRLGLDYDRRRHLVTCRGQRRIEFPFYYAGADDQAGPNFTGQPAVDSYYQR